MGLKGLLKRVFGKEERKNELELSSQDNSSQTPQKPKTFRDVPEVPIFNLKVELESRPLPDYLRKTGSMGNFETATMKLLREGAVVTSHGSLRLGQDDSLKTYDAGLELCYDGTPGDIHFNCGHEPYCEYPYRILKGPEGYKLTALSIGQDPVYFGTEPHSNDKCGEAA